MPMTDSAGTVPATISVVSLWCLAVKDMPLEEKVEKLARLALVALLFATLGWVI